MSAADRRKSRTAPTYSSHASISARKSDSLFHMGRRSRVSFKGGIGDSIHRQLLEQEVYENSEVADHFAISQWPSTDPLVSKRRSTLKLDKGGSLSATSGGLNCCFSGKKPIEGMIEGPLVKIKTDILPIDYFSNYQGSIKPQSTAIIGLDGTTTYTYEEFNCVTDHMASAIKVMVEEQLRTRFSGLAKENTDFEPCIGIASPPCERSVIIIFSIWKLGLPYLPLRTLQMPSKRIATIIESTRPILIIGELEDKVLGKAIKDKTPVISMSKLFETTLGENKAALKGKRQYTKKERESQLKIEDLDVFYFRAKREISQRAVAIFIKINGKGGDTIVCIRNVTLWNRVHAEWKLFPYEKNEVCGLYHSLDSHEFLGQIATSLLAGIKIVVMDVHDLYTFVERVKKSKLNRLIVFPDLLRALVRIMDLHQTQNKKSSKRRPQIPAFFDSVEYWFCTGTAIRRELAVAFFTYAPKSAKIVNLFGCTETLSFVCLEIYKSLNEVKHGNYYDILPMGRPVMNTRLYILDANGEMVGHSGMGEIFVTGLGVTKMIEHETSFSDLHDHSGPCTIQNIHLAEEETARREDATMSMYRTLLRSNNFGRLVYSNTKPGFPHCCKKRITLEHMGTSQTEVVIENYRVNVQEIITHLKGFPGVKSSHVLVSRPGTYSQTILAFVVVANQSLSTREELHVYLRQRIPEYMMPTIVVVTGIPVKNFQVDSAQLIERWQKERQIRHGSTTGNFQSFDMSNHPRNSTEHVTAKTMFRIFYYTCGVGEDWTAAHLNWTLTELHVPFTILPHLMTQLIRHGYYIELKDLFQIKTAKDLLTLMLNNAPTPPSEIQNQDLYQYEIIKESHEHEIVQFFLNGNCGVDYTFSIAYFVGMKVKDLEMIIKGMWPLIIAKPYSICVRSKKTKKLVAALLNTDHHSRKNYSQWEKLATEHPTKYRLEIIEQVDDNLRSLALLNDRDEKNSLQTLFFLYDPSITISYEDTMSIIQILFKNTIDLAKTAGFFSTYSIIFDYVIADLLEETFEFEIIEHKQVNMFKAKDSTRPFHLAPDNVVGIVLYKSL